MSRSGLLKTRSPLLELTRIGPAIRRGLPVTALCGAVASASFVSVPLIIERVVDRRGVGRPVGGTGDALVVIVLVFVVILFGAVCSYLVYRRMYFAAETSAQQIRRALMQSCLRRDRDQHPAAPPGDAVALMTIDTEIVARFFRTLGVLAALNLGQVVVAVVLLLVYSWQLAAVVVVASLPAYILTSVLRPRSSQAFAHARSHLGALLASLTEYLNHARVLRHWQAHRFVEDRIDVLLQRYHTDQKRAELFSAGMSAAIEVWATLSLVGSLGVGAWLLARDQLTVGELVASVFVVQLLTGPVQAVAEMLNYLQNAVAASGRLIVELEAVRGLSTEDCPARDDTRVRVVSGHGAGERIRFEGVAHRYGGPENASSLRDATFRLSSGSTTAFVGTSGSGKSTIAKLMAGILVPAEGRITVSVGEPDSGRRRLQDVVTLVPHEIELLVGSLRHNLAYPSCPLTDEDILTALKKLSMEDWLGKFPNGLDTDVETEFERFELVDRQRVAVVRAFLSQPNLLIFDESLSGVPPDKALDLCGALLAGLPDLCLVIITHVPSLAHRCDKVVVVADGEVVGHGRGDVLLRTCAEYRALTAGLVDDTT